MRVSDSNHSSIKASKKGVTFDVVETIERHTNSIDKLTTLVSKMNMKIDKRDAPYKPQIYQGGPRGQSKNRQNVYQSQNRFFKVDIEEITTTETIIGPFVGIDLETNIGVTIEEITTSLMKGETIIDKTIEETILEIDKIMAEMTLNRDIEIEVRVGKIQDITKMTI